MIILDLASMLLHELLTPLRILAAFVVPSLRREYKERYKSERHRSNDSFAVALVLAVLLAVLVSTLIYRALSWPWYARLLLVLPSALLIAAITAIVLGVFLDQWLWRLFLTRDELAASEREEALEEQKRTHAKRARSDRINAIEVGDCFISRGFVVTPIFGEVLERNESSVYARCYSSACPNGESGTVRLDRIVDVIPRSEFERRRAGRRN